MYRLSSASVACLQIVGFWFTVGESMEELDGVLRDVAKRFNMHGYEGPLLFFTDSCCKERNFLKKVIAVHCHSLMFQISVPQHSSRVFADCMHRRFFPVSTRGG